MQGRHFLRSVEEIETDFAKDAQEITGKYIIIQLDLFCKHDRENTGESHLQQVFRYKRTKRLPIKVAVLFCVELIPRSTS